MNACMYVCMIVCMPVSKNKTHPLCNIPMTAGSRGHGFVGLKNIRPLNRALGHSKFVNNETFNTSSSCCSLPSRLRPSFPHWAPKFSSMSSIFKSFNIVGVMLWGVCPALLCFHQGWSTVTKWSSWESTEGWKPQGGYSFAVQDGYLFWCVCACRHLLRVMSDLYSISHLY